MSGLVFGLVLAAAAALMLVIACLGYAVRVSGRESMERRPREWRREWLLGESKGKPS